MNSGPLDIPKPQGGASLVVAWRCQKRQILVVGNNAIAASRVYSALDADAEVTLISPKVGMCHELLVRIERSEIAWCDREFQESDLAGKEMVLVTLEDRDRCEEIASLAKKNRIPINVADMNDLCDFWFMSTYRDQSLQLAVSTNAQAPKLANRLRRHLVSSLPDGVGDAVQRVGLLRKKIAKSDPSILSRSRRMRWLAQLCEYWPLERLSQLSEQEIEELLESYKADEGYKSGSNDDADCLEESDDVLRHHSIPASKVVKKGRIRLVGSGPGNPELLTRAAYDAITTADVVLADKIVSEDIIRLIPSEVKIARKFPGNADKAQEEMNMNAVELLKQGKNVVRLKCGDPFLFGRGGEEVLFFRKYGFEAEVIPGISSCMAAPLFGGIPVTHRGTANQFMVATGTGKNCTLPDIPPYSSNRTTVFLMAIHRLPMIVQDLIKHGYPADCPVAIIERASCPDQRVLRGTISTICEIIERVGTTPPGTLVVGQAVNALAKNPDEIITQQNPTYPLLGLHEPESVGCN
ncbi:uroporphyrin-III C-m [Basidiobolus meristosporus CBS 931.73]|uniref:Uroporphyrin-III C-m n=1 Tax=Basidiobolus meristosporus CBS 931.73 TaxID=1314790 RepID=A0A1Y1VRC5_9FUNG|nr:uroporphyrin-III C-m [Basidiobolus meristosporus CBS 931.73]|eukprot:ORX63829.1 uroporphyrin-III C-m [Basidiobolus meristosporus CBS 931.73]